MSADTARTVLALTLEGVPRRVIAERLSLSSHTVDHAIEVAMHAHGVKSVFELVCTVWRARCAELTARLEARESLRHDRRSSDRRRSD